MTGAGSGVVLEGQGGGVLAVGGGELTGVGQVLVVGGVELLAVGRGEPLLVGEGGVLAVGGLLFFPLHGTSEILFFLSMLLKALLVEGLEEGSEVGL